MGVTLTEEVCLHASQRTPRHPQWLSVVNSPSMLSEVNLQNGKLKLQARSGLEYANAAANFSQRSNEQRIVNPAMGVWIHRNSPKGVGAL